MAKAKVVERVDHMAFRCMPRRPEIQKYLQLSTMALKKKPAQPFRQAASAD
jgi:hypothetical protein